MSRVRRVMWGVVNTPQHFIMGVSFWRSDAIQMALEEFGMNDWKKLRRKGWRCVKLTISYDTP